MTTEATKPYRLYRKETEPNGRVWYIGECPQIDGCIVYSDVEEEIDGLLDVAIAAMKDWPATRSAP